MAADIEVLIFPGFEQKEAHVVFDVKVFGQNSVEYIEYQLNWRAKCVFVLQELSLLVPGITLKPWVPI